MKTGKDREISLCGINTPPEKDSKPIVVTFRSEYDINFEYSDVPRAVSTPS